VSVAIIIDQIISVIVVGGPAIFLIRQFRTGMLETFLQFGKQVSHTRLQSVRPLTARDSLVTNLESLNVLE
jgi:hypothetical protein